eukprot:1142580-Pelagomonas_calceolata.AAC.1
MTAPHDPCITSLHIVSCGLTASCGAGRATSPPAAIGLVLEVNTLRDCVARCLLDYAFISCLSPSCPADQQITSGRLPASRSTTTFRPSSSSGCMRIARRSEMQWTRTRAIAEAVREHSGLGPCVEMGVISSSCYWGGAGMLCALGSVESVANANCPEALREVQWAWHAVFRVSK